MNKTAIKNYAVWARVQLIEAVKQRAFEYEITESGEYNANLDSINGRVLSAEEKEQRSTLIQLINQKGYEQVMEEAAYTWFNRFIALRFMEVNGYLPSKTRVFTDENNQFKPEILKQAMTVELDGLDREKVLDLIENQKNEELYKYLLITQCNALNSALPEMFEKIGGWTELLFPSNLLKTDSVLERMIKEIPEDNWTDQVEIIGWLYQYYNTEPKDKVFGRPSGQKIRKEDVPAATQLFTPDWIVRYMVENSLGRIAIHNLKYGDWNDTERAKIDTFKAKWKYYLEEAEQSQEIIDRFRFEESNKYNGDEPPYVNSTFLDPCMGSGHILVYAFDVFMDIYTAHGYTERDAAQCIVEKNLYGLELDDRATQLAYFAVMMKARSYDRRFLTRGIRPNLCSIQESNNLNTDYLELFGDLKPTAQKLVDEFADAKEYGSILNLSITANEITQLESKYAEIDGTIYDNIFDTIRQMGLRTVFFALLKQAKIMLKKYAVVCTNPPYMGSSGMSAKLNSFLKNNYSDSKSDLFAAFMEKCLDFTSKGFYTSMITMHSWMFLSSYEKLRIKILQNTIINMAHLGARAFDQISGEVVQTTAFVTKRVNTNGYVSLYKRLIEQNNEREKEKALLTTKFDFVATQNTFSNIPGTPLAYWISSEATKWFLENRNLGSIAEIVSGMTTGNNEIFLRMWFEVDLNCISFNELDISRVDLSKTKWIPYNKGGEMRKWYGNNEYVVNWSQSHRFNRAKTTMKYLYLQPCITWSDISGTSFAGRYCNGGFMFDVKGSCGFSKDRKNLLQLISTLNSVVTPIYIEALNPITTTQVGDLKRIPISERYSQVSDYVEELSEKCINLSKQEWDSFEFSWEYEEHPFVRWSKGLWDATAIAASMDYFYGGHPEVSCPLELCYMLWQGECNERFNQLKANEEELNRIFIEIYGLQDELTPEVEDKEVTVRKADLQREIKSLISYAVGCMFGRYSLEKEGLVFAGGDFDKVYWRFQGQAALDENGYAIQGGYAGMSKASFHYPRLRDSENWETATVLSVSPDPDNIIPICDDDYFDDDIVGLFVDFVRKVYGEDTLEANLQFIADALGGKGTSRQVIRNYFLNDFYKDHCKIYQKRPIYWLFSSGKKNGFKALIYLHRYQPDQLARMRTDYVHEQQERYRTQLQMLESSLSSAAPSEKVKLNKRIAKLKDQALELQKYEEKIHHLADQMIPLDLDDGVKVNYAKFGDVLEKIK